MNKRLNNHPFIAIEGVIGVGKTTLARLLAPWFERTTVLLEVFEENLFSLIFIRIGDALPSRRRFSFCSAATTSSMKPCHPLYKKGR